MADTLEIILSAKDGTKEAFNSLNESLGKAGEHSGGLGDKLKGLGAAALATAAVVGAALVAGAQHAISADVEWGQTLEELVKRFGMTGESASGYAVAMQHVGLTVDEGAQGLNYFARQLDAVDKTTASGKAKITPFDEALAKLGVSAHDSSGKLKTFDEIMPEIMDKFKQMPEGVNSTALAMEMFGARGGSKFIEFLRQGGGSIAQFTQQAKDMGLSMSTDEVQATEEFSRSMNDLGMSVQGVWVTIGAALMPVIKDLTTFITTQVVPIFKHWASDNMPKVRDELYKIGDFVTSKVLPALKGLWGIFQDIAAGNYAAAFDKIKGALAGIDWSGLISQFWGWITGVLAQLPDKIGSILTGIRKWIDDHGSQIADAFGEMKTHAWDWLTTVAIPDLGNVVSNLAKSLKDAVTSASGKEAMRGLGNSIGTAIGDAIVSFFKTDKSQAKGVGEAIVDWVRGVTADIGESIKTIGSEIGTGIAAGIIDSLLTALGRPKVTAAQQDEVAKGLKMLLGAWFNPGSVDWSSLFSGLAPAAQKAGTDVTPELKKIDDQFPHSLAKSGPFAVAPKWQNLFSDLLTTVPSIQTQMVGAMNQLGQSMMQGLIAGIQSQAMNVIMAIVKIIQDAINLVKTLLGIKSPSAVFAEIGSNMAQGLIAGWNAGLNIMPARAFIVGGGGGRVVAGAGGGAGGGGGLHLHFDGPMSVRSEDDISEIANHVYEIFAQNRLALEAHGGAWGG